MDKKKAYKKELDKINKDIGILENLLIEAIKEVGIEYIDIYSFISKKDALVMKKDKITYLLALEG